MDDPAGGTPRPSRSRSGRARRWVLVGLPLVLAGIVAVVVVLIAAGHRPNSAPRRDVAGPGSALPASQLTGRWSGDGALAECAGFDQGCPRTLALTLVVACPREPCTVTAAGRGDGRPPITFRDGRYAAAGPLRPDIAPLCTGTPSSGVWHLDVAAADGRLVGRYSESTVQSFDCGATSVAWDVTFTRG